MRSCFLVVFIGLTFSACEKQTSQKVGSLDSLITTNASYLINHKIWLTKHVKVGDKIDTIHFQPDSTALANDLDVFRQMGIFQKPAYRNSYQVEDGLKDENSNLSVRQFKAVKPTPLPLIRFYYHEDFENLKKIEAEYIEQNPLYSSSRHLVLEFEDIEAKHVLHGYSISGFQKMSLSDSTRYFIGAHISY
jgi:hypothetical protein